MTREDAKQYIRQAVSCKDYLRKSKSGLYVCPFCGSGEGHNGTGALKLYDTNTWTCHKCNRSGDVLDLYQNETGADYNTALFSLSAQLGLSIDEYTPGYERKTPQSVTNKPVLWAESEESATSSINTFPEDKAVREAQEAPQQAADLTSYYRVCRERLNDPAAVAYLAGRGISIDTARHYWVGFDPAADPAGSNHPAPRIIIPTSTGHYIGRSIDPATTKAFQKMNNKGGTPAIFNAAALYADGVQEVFVCEGAFDALSILEAGYSAIALNSTSNAEKLAEMLKERQTAATLILCLDNDDAGQTATESLQRSLVQLNVPFIKADICGDAKDPNEALTKDRAAFCSALDAAKRKTAAKPDNTALYIDSLMGADLARFAESKSTGFKELDRKSGGLYSGLYTVAAPSSLGKTTFCHQLAENLAEAGDDVLFFSLEQSRLELVSKSIARRAAIADPTTKLNSLNLRRGAAATPEAQRAAKEYVQAVGDRLSIIEGNFLCNLSYIRDYIKTYIKRNNTRPVVFVDYLQILQPETVNNRQQTIRETVDNTITALKQLSREFDLTIFVICAVNRNSYNMPISFESLKESGGIEYTCDVVWGLQLQCLNDESIKKEKDIAKKAELLKAAKAETPRKLELVCLKNRYGISSYRTLFNYFPANDLFLSDDTTTMQQEQNAAAGTSARVRRM